MTAAVVLRGPANAAERVVLARREVVLLRQLAMQGVPAAAVLLGDAGGLAEDLRNADVPVEVVPVTLPPNGRSLFLMPSAVARLRRVLDRLNPAIVEAIEPMPAIAAGLAAGRRVVLYRRQHQHGSVKLLAASWLAARLAQHTIVSCDAMRRVAAAADRTSPENVLVAVSGSADQRVVSSQELDRARSELGIRSDAAVIAVVSQLRWEKGIDVLLRAADRLAADRETHVIVAGTGPHETELRRIAEGVRARIHFLGHRDDVALWYALSDVVAIPSRREAFGRTTLEAMVAGRPVVASRVGGLPEAIRDGETGLLVPPEDVAALADAIRMIVSDDVLAARMRRAARMRFESHFTIGHMAAARRDVWEQALRSVPA